MDDLKEILNAMDGLIARLVQARALLTELVPSEGIQGLRRAAKTPLLASVTAMSGAKSARIRRGRGPMSPEARERMAAAQRARWAKTALLH